MKKFCIVFIIILFFISHFKTNSITKEKEIFKSRYGIRIGTGYSMNHTTEKNYSGYTRLSLGLLYHAKYLDIDLYCVTPESKATLFSSLVNIKPFLHLGFGVGYLYTTDDLAYKKKNRSYQEYYKGKYHALLGGINYRSLHNLKISLYTGITLTGNITYLDTNKSWYKYEIDNFYKFPPTAIILSIEYYINDNLSIMLSYQRNGGQGKIKEQQDINTLAENNKWMDTKIITFSMGYNLTH